MTTTSRTARTRPSRSLRGALAGLLVFLGGCASSGGSQVPTSMPAVDSSQVQATNQRILAASSVRAAPVDTAAEYRIGEGDQLDVQVFGAEAFSGSYRVEQNGVIALPLLGAVRAAGRSPRELEQTLENELQDTYMRDPSVTVVVSEMLSHGVSVIGAVQRPGVYQIPGRSTVLEVLAKAEGLTPEAGNTVFVMRRDDGFRLTTPPDGTTVATPDAFSSGSDSVAHPLASSPGTTRALADSLSPARDRLGPSMADSLGADTVIEVDLGVLLASGRSAENITVRSGDVVHVQSAGLVYVVGQVNRPGGFTVPPGTPMNALQALAMAEGLGSTARASNSVIVRHAEDGSRQEVPVNLDEVLEGSETPPTLRARDVLFVPHNKEKAFALGVVDAFVRMVTLRGLVY